MGTGSGLAEQEIRRLRVADTLLRKLVSVLWNPVQFVANNDLYITADESAYLVAALPTTGSSHYEEV